MIVMDYYGTSDDGTYDDNLDDDGSDDGSDLDGMDDEEMDDDAKSIKRIEAEVLAWQIIEDFVTTQTEDEEIKSVIDDSDMDNDNDLVAHHIVDTCVGQALLERKEQKSLRINPKSLGGQFSKHQTVNLSGLDQVVGSGHFTR